MKVIDIIDTPLFEGEGIVNGYLLHDALSEHDTQRTVLGIDPGTYGAIAVFEATPGSGGMAYIEKVASMPGNGVASTFKFGRAVGAIETLVQAHGYAIMRITPTRWKKTVGIATGPGSTKPKQKARARQIATERHPTHAHLFALVKHADRAEAVLIGEAGNVA